MDWTDITLKQFNEIKKLDLNDPEGQIRLIEVILDTDLNNYTLQDFRGLTGQISFLDKPIPEVLARTHYELRGRKYYTKLDLSELTVAGYMDFSNLSKTGDMVKILGVFLIPEGHSYNDGYDINTVYEDIESMSIVDAYAVFNFFKLEFIASYKTMKDCLEAALKMGKIDEVMIKQVLKTMDYYYTSVL